MKKRIFVLLLLFRGLCVFSQEVVYRAGVHNFFDNNEFAECPVGNSQTMAGVHFVPQIGLRWETKHRIYAGWDALHEYGSDIPVGFCDPLAYYEYDSKHFRFYMGAFPRKPVLDKYPLFFFQDSIRNYRPVVEGFFWEYMSGKGDYFNIWLDWVSRQTMIRRESFFMGWSGRYNHGVLYGQHFGYIRHFAGVEDHNHHTPVRDVGRMWTALGIDLASKTGMDALDINAGWALGLDRDRGTDDGWLTPQGILSEIRAEYRGIGIFNTYYKGDSQSKFYDEFACELYWDDRLYRATHYDRLDGYINFLKTDVVTLKFVYTLHFVSPGVFHEQQLYATFDLDHPKKKNSGKKYRYLWDNWFSQ